ncbi:MAG: PDZ domain-containing protein [Saprospiraceae bacterium]|nr:PDZ domain-containing protein [Saprospiraceae bacterium]
MKTVGTFLAAAFVLMPWCIAPLFSQQNNADKKIVITKRSVDAEGSEVIETIIKKGKAAEQFNLDEYVRNNQSDKVKLDIQVEDGENEKSIVVHGGGMNKISKWSPSCDNNGAFLGVEEDSDEQEDQPGIVVQVVRGSAAEKAGLHTNDLITSLDGQKMTRWSDLSKVVNSKKPGEKLAIAYERNGKNATTEATLTRRSEVKCDNKSVKGFLGVNSEDDNEEEAGVAVSITPNSGAQKAGLEDGDVILSLNDTPVKDFEDISDFMETTKPGDKVQVVYEREGKRNAAEATLGGQKKQNWGGIAQNWGKKDWKADQLDVNVREKEACLGVYTSAATLDEKKGAKIGSFTTESAAREVNMAEGDLILSVNGQQVQGHDELWNEIAKYKPNDKVKVEYLRQGQSLQVEATLKSCPDNSSRVKIIETDEDGDKKSREFTIWNWTNDEQRRMQERRVITIHRGEGDAPEKNNATIQNQPASPDRKLKLDNFRAFPNPTVGQLTIEFKGEPMATTVSMFDASGRQLFREEMNAFSGEYLQQFDLAEYAKGTVVVQVQQGEKLYSEQIIVN